jgi:DNA-binding transcriptional ArsR family regulator
MLRIFFTGDDIARTRLAARPDALWETVLSIHVLRSQQGGTAQAAWRRSAVAALRTSALMPDLRTLFALNPPTGYFPDFLTPFGASEGIDAGLEMLASTPTATLRGDLATLAAQRTLTSDVSALASASHGAGEMRRLTATIRGYYDVALAPVWSRVQAAVEADRSRRILAIAAQGAEGLLDSLGPAMRWSDGVLETSYPVEQEMHLAGRGLLLVPSYFCWRHPVTLLDPSLPPVLIYPAQRDPMAAVPSGQGRQALAALLGFTRAAALAAIGTGCSTTELARRVGVSPAAASQHATVLRNAGLVASRREANTMMHSVTLLGSAVLNGA